MKYILIVVLLISALALGAPTPTDAQVGDGLRVVESNAQHIVLELRSPALSTETRALNGTTYLALAASSWNTTNEPGKPQLPISSAMLAVPQNANVSVNILRDKKITREILAHPPLPAPTLRADYVADPTLPQPIIETGEDAAAYAADENFPAQLVQVSEPAQWRSQRYVTVRVNPFQYNAVRRELTTHQRVRIELVFTRAGSGSAEALGESVDEGAFESVFQTTFLNYDAAKNWRTPHLNMQTAPENFNAAAATTSYKIAVDSDGLYKIDCAALTAAGINVTTLNLSTVKISHQGIENAIQIVDTNNNKKCETGDMIVFWGAQARTQSTNTNIYWLTFG